MNTLVLPDGSAAQADEPTLLPGALIGPYRLVRCLGSGGMGQVWQAERHDNRRRVAIKILHRHMVGRPTLAERLRQEAQVVNIIDHPGVVSSLDIGHLEDGRGFIVMDFIEGEVLSHRRRLRGGALYTQEVIVLGQQVASTLSAAHQKGIVHRDLKPDNVIIARDEAVPGGERARVLDFGIAKVAREQGGVALTAQGELMGTPMYMAPEQAREAGDAGAAADVYALGVMLYELTTGAAPFHGDWMEILVQHRTASPRSALDLCPSMPAALSKLFDRMMAKAPEARPAMAEVSRILLDIAAGVAAAPMMPHRRPGEIATPAPAWHSGWLLPAGLAGALGLAVGTGWLCGPPDPIQVRRPVVDPSERTVTKGRAPDAVGPGGPAETPPPTLSPEVRETGRGTNTSPGGPDGLTDASPHADAQAGAERQPGRPIGPTKRRPKQAPIALTKRRPEQAPVDLTKRRPEQAPIDLIKRRTQ